MPLVNCSTRKTCAGSISSRSFRKAGINSSLVMHLAIWSTLRWKSASVLTLELIFLAAFLISLFIVYFYIKKPGHKRFLSTILMNVSQCSCASISRLYSMISQTNSCGKSSSILHMANDCHQSNEFIWAHAIRCRQQVL